MARPLQPLHQHQLAMTRYLRDPERAPVPAGMDPARAQVYRDLVFDNMRGLLSGTFPVLMRVLGQDNWRACVRGFLRKHRCVTPRFGEVAQEFVEFLGSQAFPDWLPFVAELAHYEWVEMALLQSEAEPLPVSNEVLRLDQPLQASPLAWSLAYQWPVHRLSQDYQPQVVPPQPTLLLVRRTPGFQVRFSELSPLAWRLLQRIGQFPGLDGRGHLSELAQEVGLEAVAFMDTGLALLRQMQDEGVVGVWAQPVN